MKGNLLPFYAMRKWIAVIAILFAAPAYAQVEMPDPSAIAGQPLPAPELPNATVSIRVVRERMGNNIAGQEVTLNVGNTPIARDALAAELDRATGGDHAARIFLRADEAVDYGQLMGLMDLLREAGYLKIALVGLESVPAAATATP